MLKLLELIRVGGRCTSLYIGGHSQPKYLCLRVRDEVHQIKKHFGRWGIQSYCCRPCVCTGPLMRTPCACSGSTMSSWEQTNLLANWNTQHYSHRAQTPRIPCACSGSTKPFYQLTTQPANLNTQHCNHRVQMQLVRLVQAPAPSLGPWSLPPAPEAAAGEGVAAAVAAAVVVVGVEEVEVVEAVEAVVEVGASVLWGSPCPPFHSTTFFGPWTMCFHPLRKTDHLLWATAAVRVLWL